MFVYRFQATPECTIVSANSTDAIKSELAAQIVGLLNRRDLTVRSAGALTATAAADLSRIRQGKLDRFTVDRLIAILTRLDQSLEVSLHVNHRPARGRRKTEGEL